MDKNQFDHLYALVEYSLQCKKNTRPVDFIPPKLQLAAVLECVQFIFYCNAYTFDYIMLFILDFWHLVPSLVTFHLFIESVNRHSVKR